MIQKATYSYIPLGVATWNCTTLHCNVLFHDLRDRIASSCVVAPHVRSWHSIVYASILRGTMLSAMTALNLVALNQ